MKAELREKINRHLLDMARPVSTEGLAETICEKQNAQLHEVMEIADLACSPGETMCFLKYERMQVKLSVKSENDNLRKILEQTFREIVADAKSSLKETLQDEEYLRVKEILTQSADVVIHRSVRDLINLQEDRLMLIKNYEDSIKYSK